MDIIGFPQNLLMSDHKPSIERQRRLNTPMHEVVKKENHQVVRCCSHFMPKRDCMTVVPNERNELVPMWPVTEWRVFMDCRKFNTWTKRYHFPMPIMDQMLDKLVGKGLYCFLDGYLGYNQISIALEDQEITTFTFPYGTFAFKRMPFGLLMHHQSSSVV